MKKSKTATTIAEAMIVTLVIVLWLTWVYKIYSESLNLTYSIENKIQAIQIAREWIEAVTNIRDTNWSIYSSDKLNCWKTLNYDSACIWDSSFTNNIKNNWNYKVLRDFNNRWILTEDTLSLWDSFSSAPYRTFYRIYLDWNKLYTHNAGSTLKQFYTRQIKTTNINAKEWDNSTINDWLEIKSIVQRTDWVSTNVHKIELSTILTNYK